MGVNVSDEPVESNAPPDDSVQSDDTNQPVTFDPDWKESVDTNIGWIWTILMLLVGASGGLLIFFIFSNFNTLIEFFKVVIRGLL